MRLHPQSKRRLGVGAIAAWTAVLLGIAMLLPVSSRATQLLEVSFSDKADFHRLLELVPETRVEGLSVEGLAARFAAEPSRAEEIRALGFFTTVVIDDLEKHLALRLGETRDADFGAYHTYPEAIAAMDALAAAYPSLMSPRQSIGQSIEGRELWVYKISDNPGLDEDEPEIFFNAYIHAREVIGFEILYDLAQYLLAGYGSDPRATAMVDTREIWIEPVVNPDGVEYNHTTDPSGGGMWRKNRRNTGGNYGIDLNRNFGYQWGYDDAGSSPYPSSETYRGTAAFSEPETDAIRDFVVGRNFRAAVNYHSYSNLNLVPYGYDVLHCPDYDMMLALAIARSGSYSPGTGWELLYPVNGDAVDWMYGDVVSKPRIFAFVTEVGTYSDYFWPPESRIAPLVAENREGNLRMIELADNPYRILPPGVAEVDDPLAEVDDDFTLTWSVPQPDPDNPAVTWNLREGTGHTVGADNLEGTNAARWSAVGWTLVTNRYHSATHSFFSGAANKANRTLTSLRGHRVQAGEQLRFWTRYDIEEQWDFGYVEIATDARTFASLPGSITTNEDLEDRNLGNGVTGSSGGWIQATFDLSAYVGEVVWVRFRFNTDQAVFEEGWYIDDIEPSDLFATEALVATDIASDEYAFVDHPLGSFSFLVQTVDVEGEGAVWGPPCDLQIDELSAIGDENGATRPWRGLELAGANPFRGPVAMRLHLPADGTAGERLTLAIHDVNGRRVATVRDEGLVESGGREALETLWDPGESASGLYFATFEVGRHRSQQRIVFMR
ncbi:MAG: M14 family zinc carboxypeptidase [Candidatus Eisenbacteria bacterium]